MDIVLIVLASLIVLAFIWGMIELKLLKVTEYRLVDEPVPESLKNKKIAVLSDLHGVYHGKNNERLLQKLKNIAPDYILLPGDLINGRKAQELEYASKVLGSLSDLKIPVLFTFGNHEEKLTVNFSERKEYEELKRISSEKSILLNDDCYIPEADPECCFVGLNLPLWIYHDHDRTGMIKKKVSDIMEKSGAEGKYTILMAHDPEHFDRYEEAGVNLSICGHLHGGIVRAPFLGGLITPRLQVFTKRSKGRFSKGKMTMIISGGVGWHDMPIRILNRPEIVVISFK